MVHFLVAKLFFILFIGSTVISGQGVADKHQNLGTNISLGEIGSQKYIQLNSDRETGFAMFCLYGKWYAVWDHSESQDIPLPVEKELPIGILNLEKITTIKTSRTCTILTMDITPEMIPIVIKTEKGWSINAISEYLLKENPNPYQVSFDQQKNGYFRILNAGNANSLILQMPTGEKLTVLPTLFADTGLDPENWEYLNIYESAQGVCLYFKSDQIFIDKKAKDISLFPANDPIIHSEKHSEDPTAPPPSQTFLKPSGLTSVLRSFLTQRSIDDPKNLPLHLLRRAWIDINLCQGDEAKQTIKMIGIDSPDMTQAYLNRLIAGIAAFLSNDYQEGIDILEKLPQTPEINFFIDLCKTQLGERVNFDKIIVPILQNYPVNLRNYILVKIVPYLFNSRQIRVFRAVQEGVPSTGIAKAYMDFYHAMDVFTFDYKDKGFALLEKIAKNQMEYAVPLELETEAKLETYLYKHADAKPEEIIKELDILRTQSRESDIEVKICLRLIHTLEKKKDFAKIIDILDDLLKRFKKFDISLGLNYSLRDYVDKFFSAENEAVSPVKTIAMFRKYKPLIELHDNYQKIAEWVAHQFERVDLLDQAAELLENIALRTTDEKHKIDLQIKVGSIYVRNYKPDDAIAYLNKIYASVPEKKQAEIAVIIANAYIQKKEFPEALKWLKYHPSKENKKLISNINIALEDYGNTITSLSDYVDSLTGKEDDPQKEVALIQLAAACFLKDEQTKLKKLCAQHKKFMAKRESAKKFNMLCRPKVNDLQSSDEVRDYITTDSEVIKEILKNGESYNDVSKKEGPKTEKLNP